MGVTHYVYDYTQGPACALACAAGTVYRNYLVDVASHAFSPSAGAKEGGRPISSTRKGQTQFSQLNNLDALEHAIHNDEERFFTVRNGYTFSDKSSLQRLQRVIRASIEGESTAPASYDDLLGLVKIGLHQDVGVTFRSRVDDVFDASEGITVTQAYCSALSCSYSGVALEHWTEFAQLALDANYEATLWAGVLNALRVPETTSVDAIGDVEQGQARYNHDVFLSFIGGGAFGNNPKWICGAIGRALALMRRNNAPIRVHICHYGKISERCVKYIEDAYQNGL